MLLLSFLCGMGSVLGIALIFGAGYLTRGRNTPKALGKPPTVDKDELEEKRKQQRQLQSDFTKLWQYNEETAYKRKEVE